MTIDDEIRREERAVYFALALAGALPVAGWLVRGGAAGAGITLCFVMIAIALYGLGRTRRRAWMPRATVTPHRRTAVLRAPAKPGLATVHR